MVIELSGIFGTIIEMNKPRDVHITVGCHKGLSKKKNNLFFLRILAILLLGFMYSLLNGWASRVGRVGLHPTHVLILDQTHPILISLNVPIHQRKGVA